MRIKRDITIKLIKDKNLNYCRLIDFFAQKYSEQCKDKQNIKV